MGRALEEEWLTATQNLRELRVGGGEASVKTWSLSFCDVIS
jgi:hypothetical protein